MGSFIGEDMEKQTITKDLIRTILQNYPEVPSHLIHKAGRDFCLSGSQRLRDLKKKGVLYSYRDHVYNFAETPPLILYGLLRG